MTALDTIQHCYVVATREIADAGLYRVSYVPRGVQQTSVRGRPKKAREYAATVNLLNDSVVWESWPTDANGDAEDMEADALRRTRAIHGWLSLLNGLIASVEGWAKELGWSTKRIEKPMEDSEVGKYAAPALLLQQETAKLLLEPISRSAPGAEGVVDLYLMPGYDDIASLYYFKDCWNLHYMFAESKAVAKIREAASKPLTKANLKRVLEEMMGHAQ